MNRLGIALAPLLLALAQPVAAQTTGHAGHQAPPAPTRPPAAQERPAMPAGHDMSRMPASPPAPQTAPARPPHDMSTMPGMPAGHDMSAMPASPPASQSAPAQPPHDMSSMPGISTGAPNTPTSADNPGRPPETPPPAAAAAGPRFAADIHFDAAAMARSRDQLRVEHGGGRYSIVLFDRLEAGFGDGQESYLWDAQGWYGGDINRFWWKSEGEGQFGGELEQAEVQALYGRAIAPYFDLQAGVRYDIRPDPSRTHLVLGVQGIAPYWFDVDTAAFLSNKGELTGRISAEYDQRVTQRLILQPRAEVNLSAEDIPELAIGTGLTSVEVGLRHRYQIHREFAPYAGVEWSNSFGDTRDFIRARGEDPSKTRLVIGIRSWF